MRCWTDWRLPSIQQVKQWFDQDQWFDSPAHEKSRALWFAMVVKKLRYRNYLANLTRKFSCRTSEKRRLKKKEEISRINGERQDGIGRSHSVRGRITDWDGQWAKKWNEAIVVRANQEELTCWSSGIDDWRTTQFFFPALMQRAFHNVSNKTFRLHKKESSHVAMHSQFFVLLTPNGTKIIANATFSLLTRVAREDTTWSYFRNRTSSIPNLFELKTVRTRKSLGTRNLVIEKGLAACCTIRIFVIVHSDSTHLCRLELTLFQRVRVDGSVTIVVLSLKLICAYALTNVGVTFLHGLATSSISAWKKTTGKELAFLKDRQPMACIYQRGGTWVKDQTQCRIRSCVKLTEKESGCNQRRKSFHVWRSRLVWQRDAIT